MTAGGSSSLSPNCGAKTVALLSYTITVRSMPHESIDMGQGLSDVFYREISWLEFVSVADLSVDIERVFHTLTLPSRLNTS